MNKPRTERPKKLTKREEKTLIGHVQKDPSTSGPQLALMVATQFNKEVRPELCCRLHEKTWFECTSSRERTICGKKNKVLRLKYAEEFIDKDNSFWSTVLFSDESKFDVFPGDGRKTVWGRKKKKIRN